MWTGKHLVALVLILAILLLGKYAWEPGRAWVNSQVEAARAIPEKREGLSRSVAKSDRSLRTLAQVLVEFEQFVADRQAELKSQATRLSQQPGNTLRKRRRDIEPAITEQEKMRLTPTQLAWAVATANSTKLSAHYRAGVEIALLKRERLYIEHLIRASAFNARKLADFTSRRRAAVGKHNEILGEVREAEAEQEKLSNVRFAEQRDAVCRLSPLRLGCERYRDLEAAESAETAARAKLRDAKAAIAKIDNERKRFNNAVASIGDVSNELDTYHDDITSKADSLRAERSELNNTINAFENSARNNWVLWVKKPVTETLPTALLILLGAIFSPMLIKAFLYYIVAPLAACRSPIRLLPDETGAVVGGDWISAVSQRIVLEQGDELLVLPEFLQSSPHNARKSDKWLLSWRMPFSSLASGMIGLTRLRSQDRDYVSISATRDPLAEVGVVTIADGAAMVLQPRSLLGVIQPIKRPMRITKHWRLGHLSAWLTLQFRYLVFHGPCTLIVQGTRGVVLEQAGSGRGINQAATMGFSAGLAYSIRPCETFGAYLMGKQGLFNDSFAGENGAYLYEEMPREGQKSGTWGRGLEGLSDAALKVFGL